MTFRNNRGIARSSVALSTLALALLVNSAPAIAQDSPAPADKAKDETIVVTGSRIARRDFKSESPISTINSSTIAAAGQPSLDRAIGQIPQFEAAQGASEVGDVQGSVGFGGGASYSDLRGIGRNRSLVLLDGRRMMPSTPDGAIDLNTIPTALLDSVEVITGGASATYGSDAVAGVANFKLKQKFSGFELNVQHGGSFKGDAGTTQISGIVGGAFAEGKGHFMMDFEYAKRDAVSGSQRSFFTQPSVRFLGRPPEGFIYKGGYGTGTSPTNAVVSAVVPGYTNTTGNYTGGIGVNTDGSLFTTVLKTAGDTVQNYKGIGSVIGDRLNDAGTQAGVVLGNYFAVQVPLTKYNVFAKSDYEFGDHLTGYAQFNFSESTALDQTSPGSTKTNNTIELKIPVANQFIQSNAALLSVINSAYGGVAPAGSYVNYSKLLFGWGNRVQNFKYDVWQGLVGLKGDIPGTKFKWDLYASYGRSNYSSQAQGDISITAINNILANEGVGGCTWNPFGNSLTGSGSQLVSAACKTYAGRTDNTTNVLTSKNVEFTVEGPLFTLPAGEARIALGADYRASDFAYQPDNLFVTGDTLAYGSDTPSSGSQNAKEVFGELLLPLLKDQTFAKDLSLDLGYRYSKYDSFAGKSTWKADLSWTPTKGLLFRGGYSVAIRAPSLADLFVGQSSSITTITVDPCDTLSSYRTGANATQVAALCSSQAAAAATYSAGGVPPTVSVQSGGNKFLQPENAKTWSVGGVLSPIKGLNISVDYYNINISGAISGLSANAILAGCYSAATNPAFSNSSSYCARVTRDSASGGISNIVSGLFNYNNLKLDGVDLQLDYRFGLDALGMSPNAGKIQLSTIISYLSHYTIAKGDGSAPVQYAGSVNDSLTTADNENLYSHPHWKANTSLGYSNGPFNGTLRWRYIGGMANLDDATQPAVPAVSYFDADAHYTFNKRFTLSVGVNNIADKGPPFIGTLELRTDAATYDVIGRTWYAAIKAKF